MPEQALVDLAPTLRLLALALLLGLLPLSWVWLRARGADPRRRLAVLTAVTLFLTFDLIVFGSFTRLTDSGLGCPDWPGCYGKASPFGASSEIAVAEAAQPTGPVTWSKAWIEMIHRYLAMMVGLLILVMTVASWVQRRQLALSPWWPTATLAWVLVQGLFGKYTVTLKLYPAIVTLHLLGGLALLVLLAVQHERYQARPLRLGGGVRGWVGAALAVVFIQVALGGWVSTNYAVLACTDFPLCNGRWWPAMDFGNGFTVLRELGLTADGQFLPMEALVAIHMVHRLFAFVVLAVGGVAAWRLFQAGTVPARRAGIGLALLLFAQVLSGLSNVVLGWPLAAALAHSAGAAALVLLLSLVLSRSATGATVAAHPVGAATARPA